MNDTPTLIRDIPTLFTITYSDGYATKLVDAAEYDRVFAELTAAREELTEAQKDYKCLAELLDGHDATECRMNLVRLKEQRDGLAEDLAKVLKPYDTCGNFGGDEWGHHRQYISEARQTLQSLNP